MKNTSMASYYAMVAKRQIALVKRYALAQARHADGVRNARYGAPKHYTAVYAGVLAYSAAKSAAHEAFAHNPGLREEAAPELAALLAWPR